jgi:hypothetical protein
MADTIGNTGKACLCPQDILVITPVEIGGRRYAGGHAMVERLELAVHNPILEP